MFDYVIEPVIVSIAVSIVARWMGLTPKYPRWSQAATMQLINTVLLTILLLALMFMNLHLSWALLFVGILSVLWLSVHLTARMYKTQVMSAPPPADDAHPSS